MQIWGRQPRFSLAAKKDKKNENSWWIFLRLGRYLDTSSTVARLALHENEFP
jgi:hypothetical protein